MPARATVIGGGVAGIAASFALRDRGYEVELWEGRGHLGGRAFSFEDGRMGGETDNGPHVMLGCYDEMRRLLRRLGTEHLFSRPRRLTLAYREEGGATSSLELSRLPTPLAMPAALLSFGAMSWSDRWRALRGMVGALRGAPADWSLEEWLEARRQSGGPRRFLWEPLCLAVMNAEPAEVSAALFLGTLQRAFSGSAANAAIWVPAAPWSEIIGRPAVAALKREGVAVRLNRRVRAVELTGGRVVRVRSDTVSWEPRGDDRVVSAVPWQHFARLFPEESAAAATFDGRAIYNVYFAFDGPVLQDEGALTALVDGRPFQFVYRSPGAPAGRFALIASACAELEGCSVADIELIAREQLARYYPGATLPEVASVRVTKEPAATLVTAPEVVARRPPVGRHPRVANLAVCGDWTQTQLPSTLEGAAASGFGL